MEGRLAETVEAVARAPMAAATETSEGSILSQCCSIPDSYKTLRRRSDNHSSLDNWKHARCHRRKEASDRSSTASQAAAAALVVVTVVTATRGSPEVEMAVHQVAALWAAYGGSTRRSPNHSTQGRSIPETGRCGSHRNLDLDRANPRMSAHFVTSHRHGFARDFHVAGAEPVCMICVPSLMKPCGNTYSCQRKVEDYRTTTV